jgi:hypothetical protein
MVSSEQQQHHLVEETEKKKENKAHHQTLQVDDETAKLNPTTTPPNELLISTSKSNEWCTDEANATVPFTLSEGDDDLVTDNVGKSLNVPISPVPSPMDVLPTTANGELILTASTATSCVGLPSMHAILEKRKRIGSCGGNETEYEYLVQWSDWKTTWKLATDLVSFSKMR